MARTSTKDSRIARLVGRAYQRSRVPFAYGMMVLGISPQLLPVPPGVGVAAISALGFVVLSSVLDIEEHLFRTAPARRFTEFYEVASEMRSTALARVKRSDLKVQALGMSMGHAWTFLAGLLDEIARDPTARDVRVEVAMLDPSWSDLSSLNPAWPARCATNKADIERFIAERADLFSKRGWAFRLDLYRHMPNWHGICVNHEVLFLSTCSWENGHLLGGNNEYERFERGQGEQSDRAFELFAGWLAAIQAPSSSSGPGGLGTTANR